MNIKDVEIRELMSTKLKTLHPKDKLRSAKEIFDKYEIHHIPVHVMGDIRGILSVGDILFIEGYINNNFDDLLKEKKLELTTVEEVMTQRPYCAQSSDMLSDVIEKMTKKRVNALPIVENGELVGIITTHDILKYFVKT